MNPLRKTLSLLNNEEKKRLIPLSVGVLVMAVLEVVGISSLGPFMAVVSDPGVIYEQPILRTLYDIGKFQSDRAFLIALGIGAFLLILIATVFKLLVQYSIIRYAQDRRYTLSLRLLRRYLTQPYSYFLNHNTTELSKNILAEVNQVVDGVLRPALDVFSRGFLSMAILSFLLAVNPWVALISSAVLGSLYLGLYGVVRPKLTKNGAELRESNRLRYKFSSEAFGAIKDVKIMGKEGTFASSFGESARRFSVTLAARQVLSRLPSHAMQSFSAGFAIALVVVMLTVHGSIVEVLPLLAIYAFSVQRLMPNLQAVFVGVAGMRYYSETVNALYEDMTGLPDYDEEAVSVSGNEPREVFEFNRRIEFDHVQFSYPGSTVAALKDVSLSIDRNTTVGFVGPTGCGKTTLVDVLMGLLLPSAGAVQVDGKTVSPPLRNETLRAWQRNFGYVPQHIYLSDDTVAANIAFGIPEGYRDIVAVRRAAEIANLNEFVEGELPDGYDTIVGERGIRLSGGQRQRIGIARALYHDPCVVVMDEATSALDSVTEEAVMEAIHNLMHTKTIILIAHRITTVQECDAIFVLDGGKVVDRGRYADLINSNAAFRAMAKVQL